MTGLIGWWPLHENSGDTARDLSGNGNNAALVNNPLQGVAGKGGLTGYSFDASNPDYLVISDGDDGNKPLGDSGSSEFTISAWIYVHNYDVGGVNEILNRNYAGTGDVNYLFRIESTESDSNYKKLNFYDGDNAFYSESIIPEKTWKHVVLKYIENESIEFYVDGQLDAVREVGSINFTSNADVCIGQSDTRENRQFSGKMCDVRIYNRAVSPEEVQELYKWGYGDYARPLNDQNSSSAVSRWAFDGDATDSWGENDGVVNGATYISDNVISGEALDFDSGNNDYVGAGNDSSLNPDNITISAWVNSDDVSLSGGIVTRWGTGTDWSYILRTYNGNFRFQARDANDNGAVIDKNGANNEYYHLVMTYDGNLVKAYMNGSLVETDNSLNTSLKSSTKTTVVGNADRNGDYNRPFDGIIDDVRIYDRALEPHEVFELYRWGTRGIDMRKKLVNQK